MIHLNDYTTNESCCFKDSKWHISLITYVLLHLISGKLNNAIFACQDFLVDVLFSMPNTIWSNAIFFKGLRV